MKLEIEITEEEIKSALERKVRVAIAEHNSAWGAENHIKERVKVQWTTAVESLVAEMIGDSEALKLMIEKAVENKVKARVTAALRSI